MAEAIDEKTIRQYLLGEMAEAAAAAFEERLMSDDGLYEMLLVIEDELIDERAAGELSAEEQARFDTYFLATPQRRERLELALALYDYAARRADPVKLAGHPTGGAMTETPNVAPAEAASEPAAKDVPSPGRVLRPPRWSAPRRYLTLAAAAVILLGLALGVWWWMHSSGSDVRKGLQALNDAYRNQRPTEARLTGFDYAPLPMVTRGDRQENVDRVARNRAERILQDEAAEHPSAQSYHALGRLYLAEHRLDEAIEQFQKAANLEAKNAQLESDYGVALMEIGKSERAKDDPGKSFEDFARSLEHLSKAIDLDGSLLEALFNRAILYQHMMLPQQAEEDWHRYLEKDTNSPWAEEARQNLKRLEEKKQTSLRKPGELLPEFLKVYQSGSDDSAFELMSRSTEAITGKLIWWQLLGAYLDRSSEGDPAEANLYLQALSYAGRLQEQKTSDRFISELSRFYRASPPAQQGSLALAHRLIDEAHRFLAESETDQSFRLYRKAKALFDQTGNQAEGRFADYYIGYCFYRKSEFKKSLLMLSQVAEYSRTNNYLWLLECALTMMANLHGESNQFSLSLAAYKESLEISRKINDEYNAQRNLASLAYYLKNLGNRNESLAYIQQCLDRASNCLPGARQMYRNLDTAAGILNSFGYFATAAAYEKAALQLAIEAKDPGFEHLAYMQLGAIYAELQDDAEALKCAERSYQIAQAMSVERTGLSPMALSSLQLGHLYRRTTDYDKALWYYDDAIRRCTEINLFAYLYEAHKGRLLCYVAQGNDALAENELQTVLAFFEEHRAKIKEEQNRNSFFDLEQYVYDIAIDFEYTRTHDYRKAFEYSERSRARSLLDMMNTGVEVTGKHNLDAVIPPGSPPLMLAGIRQTMPEHVQLLQYAVLDDKLLIWVVSRSKFEVVEEKITSRSLTEKTLGYWRSLSRLSEPEAEASRRQAVELYDILIRPVNSLLEPDKQICIVPDKALNYLPFNALIASETGRYLINDYVLSFAPSANTFLRCSQEARERSRAKDERILSVGNPRFNRTAFPDLDDLPSSGREAEEVARCYTSRCCLVGENARKARISSEMAKADIIHIASHYVIDEHNPMLSKLLLTDAAGTESKVASSEAVLQAQDIYQKKLPRARLVTLSACQTGIEQYYKGEGMIGMSRPFLAADVPLVVASLWPVASAPTADLMISFHKHRKPGIRSSAEALRQAQLDMINDSSGLYSQPYYWAPFILIGGHAGF
jgi:CHAT domain-containing protein